ncbi:MAG TPA: YggS family pyridoxal phosphate-dependent enzyme [Bacillota bacterium]
MGLSDNLELIRKRITAAAARVNRDPARIKLIAVTKYVDLALINEAIHLGITDIAENRVQDALRKLPGLAGPVTKHFIGTLQTNKVKPVIKNFDLIHSVDRIELIKELAKQAQLLQKPVKLLIQLNISGETTKHGFAYQDFSAAMEQIRQYPYLKPCGLMTMAPLSKDPETARPVFRRLKEIFKEYKEGSYATDDWQYLSMGMSQDFEVAVEEGANLLRIGTAIFSL